MDVIGLELEIAASSEPVTGRVRRDDGWLLFTGWAELGEAIVRLVAESPADDGRGQACR